MPGKRSNEGKANSKPLEVRYLERCVDELNEKMAEYNNIQYTTNPGKRQNRVRLLKLQIEMQQRLDDIRYLKSNSVVEAFKKKKCRIKKIFFH